MSQKITITLKKGQPAQVQTEGFTGTACQVASQPFEAALGTTVTTEPTPEAYVQVETSESVQA